MIISVQTTGNLSTNSGSWTPIQGLALKLPEGVDVTALLILNVPNPYAKGNDYPGGNFAIAVNGTVQPATATFTYNEQVPQSTGRIPTTLCVAVPLGGSGPSTVTAMWQGVRGSTVNIDSPSTLSAVI
jgi:mannose-binding lectin